MYAVYSYNTGITQANLLADVVKLLTGTTDKTLLSADCNQAKSLIIATEPAGWTLYDAAAGVNAVCLRAPVYDNPNQYKYIVIDTNTAGNIYCKVYEAWNATTHTGTNLSSNSGTAAYAQRIYTTGAGRLDIKANVRQCMLFSTYVHVTSGLIIGASTPLGPSGIVEFKRYANWDTTARGYPNYAFLTLNVTTGQFTASTPRLLGSQAESDATAITMLSLHTHSDGIMAGYYSAANIGAWHITSAYDKRYRFPFMRFGIGNVASLLGGGEVSEVCDIYYILFGKGMIFNKAILGSDTYIIWGANVNWYFAIKYA